MLCWFLLYNNDVSLLYRKDVLKATPCRQKLVYRYR